MRLPKNVICIKKHRKLKELKKAQEKMRSSNEQVKELIDSLKKMAELYETKARTSP